MAYAMSFTFCFLFGRFWKDAFQPSPKASLGKDIEFRLVSYEFFFPKDFLMKSSQETLPYFELECG
jgi:hypothetical protein